jgi:S-adenosylmethionine:tRNA ribosyltransferase-isomerase
LRSTHPRREGLPNFLVYRKGKIQHQSFGDIVDHITEGGTLVFNDTKVIPARIILHKETGARIEIFLLEPIAPSSVHEEVMATEKQCTWKCMIGNAKKWKMNTSLRNESLNFFCHKNRR